MQVLDKAIENNILSSSHETLTQKEKEHLSVDILVSLFAVVCLGVGFLYKTLYPAQSDIAGLIYLVGIVVQAVPVFTEAIQGFLSDQITNTMEILVAIAILASFVTGQYEVAILVPVILTFVHFLEERSIMGGRDAIEGLKKIQSDDALLLTDSGEKQVRTSSLRIGDVILVKPGMALPIDGTVKNGVSSIDQKSLTGEPLPRLVKTGDTVFAGTVNIDGVLQVTVEKEFFDTSFSKIVELLKRSQEITIPEIRVIDRFMAYFIPVILLIAIAVAFVTMDISKAVAILVVSCPCGQVLIGSAPMIAVLAVTTKKGILVKNAKFLETLSDINMIIFDKTGTITTGTLTVNDCRLQGGASRDELISSAASVAKGSLHPISKAVLCEIGELEILEMQETREEIGCGLIGKSGDSEIYFGNRKWLVSLGFSLPEDPENLGPVNWVIKDGHILGCILFGDSIRGETSSVIEKLKKLGIEKTQLLTGDTSKSTDVVRTLSGIDSAYAELMPAEKLERVKLAKEKNTIMFVGDGINDALALSEADVGIAMGAMGSDVAINSADIALMNNDLNNIVSVIELSRITKKTIYQNIAIAFSISFVMITLASFGIVTAVGGAILHNVGAFFVILNSSRILRYKTEK